MCTSHDFLHIGESHNKKPNYKNRYLIIILGLSIITRFIVWRTLAPLSLARHKSFFRRCRHFFLLIRYGQTQFAQKRVSTPSKLTRTRTCHARAHSNKHMHTHSHTHSHIQINTQTYNTHCTCKLTSTSCAMGDRITLSRSWYSCVHLQGIHGVARAAQNHARCRMPSRTLDLFERFAFLRRYVRTRKYISMQNSCRRTPP